MPSECEADEGADFRLLCRCAPLDITGYFLCRSHTHSRRSNQEQGSDKGKQIKEAQQSYQVDEDKKSKK